MKSNYVKSGLWYLVGNLLIKGISFFTLPVFTRLLNTSDFGNYNLFISFENIINVVLGLGIAGTIKTAFIDFKDKFNNYFSSCLFLTFSFSLFVSIFINLYFLMFRNQLTGIWNFGTCNLLILYSLATALYNLISLKYVITVEYKKNIFLSFLYTLLSVSISVVLCFYFLSNKRYLARIIGNAIPLIGITFFISMHTLLTVKSYYNKEHWKYALSMGSPLIFHSLSLVVMQQADKIMVDYYCGSDANGIYSLACTMSSILTIIQSSIDSSWSPWFYKRLNEKQYKELREKNELVVVLFVYLTSCFILISPELIRIASPRTYHRAIYALIPLIVSVYVSFMYMFAVNKEYFHKKTKTIAIATVITTIVDIALNRILIPKLGFVVASFTTLFSKVLLFIIHWRSSNKIDKNEVVSIKKLMISLFAILIVAGFAYLFLNRIAIRFIAAFIISINVFCYFLRNENMENLIVITKKRNRNE